MVYYGISNLKNGVAMPKQYKGVYHKYRDLEWVKLYQSGISIYDIAATWHYNYGTVSRVLRYHGIYPPHPQIKLVKKLETK